MKVLLIVTKSTGGSGNIVGEFRTNKIFKIHPLNLYDANAIYARNILKQACLTKYQFLKYANNKVCYAWNVINPIKYEREFIPTKRTPQSWVYLDENTILMSIYKEWADKIFSGKKTLEIRKTHPKFKEEK